jgi:DNA polymerase III alpha subunit
LGSTLSVADLVTRASAEGMTHLALTDTHVLYGVLAFNRACQAAGLQAMIGLTVTVAAEAWPSVGGKNTRPSGTAGYWPGRISLLVPVVLTHPK